MKDLLKRTGSMLVIAGSLFLFALACAESPMAPASVDENTLTKPGDQSYAGIKPVEQLTVAKQDTVPTPP